jgi:hypothetical protein
MRTVMDRVLTASGLAMVAVSMFASTTCAADVLPPTPAGLILVTGTEPERYVLYNSSLNAFHDIERARRPQFDNAMRAQNLQLGHDIQAAIAQRLGQAGYSVQLRDIPHRAADELLRPSEVANVGADVVVDVVLEHAQYANTPFSRGLRPSIWLRVRAIDVRAQKYLFKERFTYDGHHSPIVTINVEPDPKYEFRSEAALFADPAFAAEGLRAAAPLIAEQVALLFAKHR